jgi:hypothetical protein
MNILSLQKHIRIDLYWYRALEVEKPRRKPRPKGLLKLAIQQIMARINPDGRNR